MRESPRGAAIRAVGTRLDWAIPARTTVLLVATIILIALASSGTVGLATSAEDPHVRTPGEQFGGVIGVQDAELEGDLDERRFNQQLARADSDAERAAVVADRASHIEDRLADLEARLDELETARSDGEIPVGRYEAAVAAGETERVALERAAEQNAVVAAELPEPARQAAGVDEAAIRAQHDQVAALGGSESAAVAADVAGERAGDPPGADRRLGPPDDIPSRSGQ